MHLKFGSYPVLVASSAEMAKEFLKNHDHIFASRHQTAVGKYTNYNYNNIVWAPYGRYWRQGCKIYLNELFSSKRLESFEYIRVEEMRAFLSHLYGLSGKPIVLKDLLSRFTLSIISRMVLGKKYFSVSGDDQLESNSILSVQEFQVIQDEWFLLNGEVNIGDWVSWLDFLDLQGYLKRMKALRIKLDRFYDHVLDEHMRKKKELERVISRERWVKEKDIPQLTYLDAIMKETMRKHPVAALVAPHLAMEDCNVAGYDIPKGTQVFINTWSMGRDSFLWEQPDEFWPERFVERKINIKGQNFELFPFGSRRRMCPGYTLGLKMIQKSLANLLHWIQLGISRQY